MTHDEQKASICFLYQSYLKTHTLLFLTNAILDDLSPVTKIKRVIENNQKTFLESISLTELWILDSQTFDEQSFENELILVNFLSPS